MTTKTVIQLLAGLALVIPLVLGLLGAINITVLLSEMHVLNAPFIIAVLGIWVWAFFIILAHEIVYLAIAGLVGFALFQVARALFRKRR